MAKKVLFKQTSRSYFDIFNPLLQAYPSKPTFLWNEIAALFDFGSELLNRIATDILDPVTREAAYGFAARNDYEPTEADGSTVTVDITLTSAMAKTLTAGYQVAGISSSTGDLVIFELTANASSGGGSSISGAFKQAQTVTDQPIGTIAGDAEFPELPIVGFQNIIKSSISLDDGTNSWSRVDNFDASISTDRHFVLLFQSNGKARVQFGDDTNGLKPVVGTNFTATFEVTKGTLGRMEAAEITINTGGDTDILSLTNASATSGGNDSESVASIIRNSRANVRLRDAVFTKEDLETASRQASSSVVKALGIPGIGAAVIQIIPSGGGLPSGGLKTTVDDFVTALTQFGVVPISVVDPNYLTQAVTVDITVRSGFTSGTVQDLVDFAMALTTSAIDVEVIESFDDNGIDQTRTAIINPTFGFTFTSAENDALAAIVTQWQDLLGDRDSRDWAQPLELGDLYIMGNGLFDFGVDVFSVTTPSANVTTTATQIIDSGTITVNIV